jgi:hypothetical protein
VRELEARREKARLEDSQYLDEAARHVFGVNIALSGRDRDRDPGISACFDHPDLLKSLSTITPLLYLTTTIAVHNYDNCRTSVSE